MSIATRTGDDGTTRLLYGQRVPKDHPQIEAVGAFDELNVALGAIKPLLSSASRDRAIAELLVAIQRQLVALMGELACDPTDLARYADSQLAKLTDADLERLDHAIAELEGRGLKFTGWATPGANARASACDFARVTARRAERRLVAFTIPGRAVRPLIHRYINRLSDVLWLLAREAES